MYREKARWTEKDTGVRETERHDTTTDKKKIPEI